MSFIKQTKEQGVSLRMTFLIMLLVSVLITSLLLFTTYQTIMSFHALSNATDIYIDLQDAADSLMSQR